MADKHSPEHGNDRLLAAEALDLAAVFEACESALLNRPDDTVVANLRVVAQTAGIHDFDDAVADEALRTRYAERFTDVDGPLYVPLNESSVVGSTVGRDGIVCYGPAQDDRTAHVLNRYEELGFDPTALVGDPRVVELAKPDSAATELAFLAFLKREEAASWQMGDHASAVRWHETARSFAREHPNAWMALGAERLAAGADDLYARVCNLAAETVVRVAKEG